MELVALLVLAASALYAAGVWNLWRHAGRGRGIAYRQVAFFIAGTAAIAVALLSPLDELGERSFAAHMLQHEILMLVAAPLMVLARPLGAWTWAFALRTRRRIGGAVRRRAWAALWRFITDPLAAWGLHAVALWVWHVPALFEAAVENEAVHALQHASFLATALLFWWTVIGVRASQAGGPALASLFTTMLHTSALGALLTLTASPWYPRYELQDQQLGGLIMWVPGATAYLFAALAIMARLLRPATRAPLAPLRSDAP
jgi:putative membrane protein